jgi:hypothetical protein
MKILVSAVISVLVLAGSVFAFQDPDNFRGIPWGASPLEAKNAITDGWNKRGVRPDRVLYTIRPEGNALLGEGRLKHFRFSDMVGGALADFRIFSLDEKFVHAEFTFHPGHFSIMETAFKECYGPPTSEEDNEIKTEQARSLRIGSLYGLDKIFGFGS